MIIFLTSKSSELISPEPSLVHTGNFMSYYFDEERGRYFKITNGHLNLSTDKYHNNSIQIKKRTNEFHEEELKRPKTGLERMPLELNHRIFNLKDALINIKLGHYDCNLGFNTSGFDWEMLQFEQTMIKEEFLGALGLYSIHRGNGMFKFYLRDVCVASIRIPIGFGESGEYFKDVNGSINWIECTQRCDMGSNLYGIELTPGSYHNGELKRMLCPAISGLFVVCLRNSSGQPCTSFLHLTLGKTCSVVNYTSQLFHYLDQFEGVSKFGSCALYPNPYHYKHVTGGEKPPKSLHINISESQIILSSDKSTSKINYSMNKSPEFLSYRSYKSRPSTKVVIDGEQLHFINSAQLNTEYRGKTYSQTFEGRIFHVLPMGGNQLFIMEKEGLHRVTMDKGKSILTEDLGKFLNNTNSLPVIFQYGEIIVINEDLNTLMFWNIKRGKGFGMEKKRVKLDLNHLAVKISGAVESRLIYLT